MFVTIVCAATVVDGNNVEVLQMQNRTAARKCKAEPMKDDLITVFFAVKRSSWSESVTVSEVTVSAKLQEAGTRSVKTLPNSSLNSNAAEFVPERPNLRVVLI